MAKKKKKIPLEIQYKGKRHELAQQIQETQGTKEGECFA
jgi:hypothetical protein